MSAAMKVLLRVKQLKEQDAFRALMRQRELMEEARRQTDAAREAVAASARTLPAREDAIYREILGEVIDSGDLDETRGKVVALQRDHGRLTDALERAIHVQASAEKQLEAALANHRAALKKVDKYVVLTDEISREIAAIASAKEETEIEDLFGTRRRRP